MNDDAVLALEEKIAHITRVTEELSDVIARQDAQITRLARQVEMLIAREAEREADGGGSAVLTDKPPPHW